MHIKFWSIYALMAFALCSQSVSAADDLQNGKVILSISSDPKPGTVRFSLFFRTLDGKHNDWISYRGGGFFDTGDDFKNDTEKGSLRSLTLPSGEWEIDGVELFDGLRELRSSKEFSAPFTVTPGGTIYIGNYRGIWGFGRNIFGLTISTGATFVLSDKSERDVPIAKSKDHSIADVRVELPDISHLAEPYIVAAPAASATP